MIPPKPTKAPLRRIVKTGILRETFQRGLLLECGHYLTPKKYPKGTIESWRRVRCKECIDLCRVPACGCNGAPHP